MAGEKGEAAGVDSGVKEVRVLLEHFASSAVNGDPRGMSTFCEISPGDCGPILKPDIHLYCMR